MYITENQFILIISSYLCFHVISSTQDNEGYRYLTTPEIIMKEGYPAETHLVTTADGYILAMHRIPFSPKSPIAEKKPAVFLQHGLFASSADWTLMGPDNSLGFLLADEGYDVFMGNVRGNRYSKQHVSLSPKSKEFWDFSWDEMAMYDIPAEIDYILNITNEKRIHYVGMSMGTTLFFALASERPEYNQKIKIMIAECPVAFYHNKIGPVVTSKFRTPLLRLFRALGMEEVFPTGSPLFSLIGDKVCTHKIARVLCSNWLFFQMGFDPKQLNETLLPTLYAHYPAGTSLKTVWHYSQLIDADKFQKWDYGPDMNMVKYNQSRPPEYNLSVVTAPIALLYGENDLLSHPKDVLQLSKVLPNCVEVYLVKWKTFTHVAFIFANDVKTLVNDEVIRLIKQY